MNKIQTLEQLKTFIQNEPLIEAEPTILAIKPDLLISNNASIFFGVGIVSKNNISSGVPFDILGMFFASELLRQVLGFKKAVVLIADSHALANKIFTLDQVREVTLKTRQTLQKITTNFNLSHFELLTASEISKQTEFQKLLENLPQMSNEYLRLEIADSLFSKIETILKLNLAGPCKKITGKSGMMKDFLIRT